VELHGQGYEVVRADAAPPPQITDYPRADWPELFGRARLIVVSSRTRVPAELLAWAPRLEAVVFPSTGVNSCDLPAATAHGVLVANGATRENCESMAEATVMLAVALLLDLPRKTRQFVNLEPRPPIGDLRARMLAGKTVGLIGFGGIARAVVERLVGWRVSEILVYTRTVPAEAGRVPLPVRFVEFDTLLRESDVISLHVPLDERTRGLIGADELARMKPGVMIVNTARGGLIDEIALAEALQDGQVGGAAIDTFDPEPPDPAHPLRRRHDVILTGHIVGHTRELFDSLLPTARANIARLLNGEPPLHLCNPRALPAWRARLS
jgi:D-3-phosphoglycerate dehydrogenase